MAQNEETETVVSLPIPELRYDTDKYIKQKKAYTYRTIGNILSGSSPKTKDREELIQKYYDLLANLDESQKELLAEVEKTGRISQTNFTNLIGHFAKVRAATEGARGGVISARTEAGVTRLKQLEDQVKRFGAKSELDLPEPYTKSAAQLNQWVEGGRVTDGTAFGKEITAKVKELTVTDPTLVVPYLQKVQTDTGVNLQPIIMQTATGKAVDGANSYGVPSNILSELANAAQFGIQEHKQGMDFNDQKYAEMAHESASMAEDMGWAGAKTLFNDLQVFVKGAPSLFNESGATSLGGERIPNPPPESATFDEKAAWVQQVFGDKAEMRSDGKVYEKGDTFNPAEGQQSMDYGVASRIFGNPAGYKMMLANSGPKFITDSRNRLLAKIKELETSDLPEHVMTRNMIIKSPFFQDWAQKRGYIDTNGNALMPNKQLFGAYIAEHKGASQQRSRLGKELIKQNKASNPDMPVSVTERVDAQIDAYSDLPEREDAGSSASAITTGAAGPEQAAGITEEAAARGEPKRDGYKEFVDYKDVAEGRSPWKYRVYDSGKIEVIGKPGSTDVTPDKPMEVKVGSRAYTAIKTMADTPEATAIAQAANVKLTPIPNAEPFTPDQIKPIPNAKGKPNLPEDLESVMEFEEDKISAKGVEPEDGAANPEAEDDIKGDITDIADEERVKASNKGAEISSELAAQEERAGQFEKPIEADSNATDLSTVDTGVPDPNQPAPATAPKDKKGLLNFLKNRPVDETPNGDNSDQEDAQREQERKEKKDKRIEEVEASAENQAQILGNLTPEQIARRERRLKLLRGEIV